MAAKMIANFDASVYVHQVAKKRELERNLVDVLVPITKAMKCWFFKRSEVPTMKRRSTNK